MHDSGGSNSNEWSSKQHTCHDMLDSRIPIRKILGLSQCIDCPGRYVVCYTIFRDRNVHLLMVQNTSGGYSSFEPIQGGTHLELLNGTELFGKVMVEYDYVECTSSAITALCLFMDQNKEYRAEDVKNAIHRGAQYIRQAQNGDGGWLSSWGIAYIYGAFFALETLSMAGDTYDNSAHARRGWEFLLKHQKPDGGWGETREVSQVLSI